MAEIDPYATLGVSRTATRDEIARAYRALAKRHHPDAGATPSAAMARINEAWHVLSDVNRRARWDRLHEPVLPPHWAAAPGAYRAAPAVAVPRPPGPPATTTVRDSPWLAVGAVVATMTLVAAALLAISVFGVSQASEATSETVELGPISMSVPMDWTVARGPAGPDAAHRVLAHVVTFPVLDDELCTAFGEPCPLAVSRIPVGEASIIITAWSQGTPPVPEPVVELPAGLDADRMIGGQAAAFDLRRSSDGYLAWWQLSPPGFPERWIEVSARIGGQQEVAEAMLAAVDAMIESIEFVDEGP